ncbi:MAG: hypothetical protein E4G95_00380 [Bacteroidia bacterium]|nr:MAG: hypothetical protein E4G95_00380 [Bacteroidia bacterium]
MARKSGISSLPGLFGAILIIFPPGYVNGQEMGKPVSDTLTARKDAIDVVLHIIKKDSARTKKYSDKKFFFSLAPLAGGSGEQGLSLSSINASFYLGDPATTKMSNINFYPNTNFSSLFQFIIDPNLWASENRWNINGNFEISRIQQETYGMGSNTFPDSLLTIDFNQLRTYIEINRKILRNLFIGAGYKLDKYYNLDYDNETYPGSSIDYEYGTTGGSFSSGISFNLLYDSRKNPINSLQGLYTNAHLRISSPMFGSEYTWNSITLDIRKYFRFSRVRHRTLALWGLYWSTWGEVPYLDLPGSRLYPEGLSGRGYKRGRYRGKKMIYGEAEYRFDITNSGLLGAVMFVNVQSFSEPETENFEYLIPAGGIGLRLKFNKYSDSNITSDFAFGKNSFIWYVGLNEAF